jgi:actin beta/gamma 1
MDNIVFDNGTGYVKAGFAGHDLPMAIIPNVIGFPKYGKSAIFENNINDYQVGLNALMHKGIMKLEYPMKNGIITNWDDMELVWANVFDNLRIDINNQNQKMILITEPPLNPIKNKDKMIEIMFEKFNMDKVNIEMQAVLSLYASGRTTGLVLDSGDGVTHTIPVYEGYKIENAILRNNLAGRDITNVLFKKCNFTSSSEREIVKKMKEKVCYIKINNNAVDKIDYELPDGSIITLGDERTLIPEILFNPSLNGLEMPGHHELITMTIDSSPIDIRKELLNNIVLSGGTTMFKGYKQRLIKELNTDIICPLQRKFTVWIGGSILASLSSYKECYITRNEYYDK